jgi:hypothetical protein
MNMLYQSTRLFPEGGLEHNPHLIAPELVELIQLVQPLMFACEDLRLEVGISSPVNHTFLRDDHETNQAKAFVVLYAVLDYYDEVVEAQDLEIIQEVCAKIGAAPSLLLGKQQVKILLARREVVLEIPTTVTEGE